MMQHGWVEEVLMDVMVYVIVNGVHRVDEAIEPALMAAGALGPQPAHLSQSLMIEDTPSVT